MTSWPRSRNPEMLRHRGGVPVSQHCVPRAPRTWFLKWLSPSSWTSTGCSSAACASGAARAASSSVARARSPSPGSAMTPRVRCALAGSTQALERCGACWARRACTCRGGEVAQDGGGVHSGLGATCSVHPSGCPTCRACPPPRYVLLLRPARKCGGGGGGTSRLASGQAGAQLGGELAGRLGDQARPGRAAAGKVHQILERIGQRAASHSPVRWQRISLGAGTPAEDRGRHESHACGPAFKWCCTGRSQRAPSWLAPSIVSRQKSGPVPGLCNHGRQLAARLQR